jgi:hypothetical protein
MTSQLSRYNAFPALPLSRIATVDDLDNHLI